MKHIFKKSCVDNAQWINDELMCKCGNRIAVRYKINNEVKIYTYWSFIKYENKIKCRKDNYKIAGSADIMGNLDNSEWNEILDNIR